MGSIVSSVTAVGAVSPTMETVLFRATWNGVNGAGPISIPGLQVGDRLLQLMDSAQGIPELNSAIPFYVEIVVSVADELHQNHPGNLTPTTYDGVFVRGL